MDISNAWRSGNVDSDGNIDGIDPASELLSGVEAHAALFMTYDGVTTSSDASSQAEGPHFAAAFKNNCPGPPGRVSGLSVSHSKSNFYNAFVWARGALNGPFRRLPARAGSRGEGSRGRARQAAGWCHQACAAINR